MTQAGYVRGRIAYRADLITSVAKQEGLEERIFGTAERVAEETKRNIRAATPLDQSDADALTTYYDAVKVVDGGKDYRRQTYPRGSKIRVALITTAGAGFSAGFTEYGTSARPGLFPMTKAVYELGGEVT